MAGWRCLTSPTPSRSPAMTEVQGKLSVAAAKELLKGSPDGLREIVRAVLREVLEAEMTDVLGAAEGERTAARLGYRAGYYSRTLVTRVGKLELRVPRAHCRCRLPPPPPFTITPVRIPATQFSGSSRGSPCPRT